MSQPTKDKVIEVLSENGFTKWADKLSILTQQLEQGSDDEKISAAREIQGLCNMRSLGDLKITNMSGWEWNTLLEKLNKNVQKKIKSLTSN